VNDLELTEEDIQDVLGFEAERFLETMVLIEDMIDHPDKYTGQRALLESIRLSAYRTKIGTVANWLKSQEKSIMGRRKKDLLLSMERNLEENINCLKLAARVEAKAVGHI
jgi:hypothetical protein